MKYTLVPKSISFKIKPTYMLPCPQGFLGTIGGQDTCTVCLHEDLILSHTYSILFVSNINS